VKRNRLQEAVKAGRVPVGHMIWEFSTRGIAKLVESADLDFVLIDMEHSEFDLDKVADLIAWFKATNIAPFVRVPGCHYHFMARVMDGGALGVMIPNLETPEQARTAVNSVKYAPMGKRGVGLEYLDAVDAVAIAVGRRRRGEIGDRAARFGLGHADGDHRFAAKNLAEITVFLVSAAIFGEHAHRAEVAGLNHIRAARTGFGHRFNRQNRIHQRAALPAIGLGKSNAHQALFGHQLRHVPRVLGLVRAGECAGFQMLLRKAADGIAELLLFGGKFEVHFLAGRCKGGVARLSQVV